MKKFEELCTQEQMEQLISFRIEKRNLKLKVKEHKFIVKMIKRARILGLLPFTHMNLTA
jgi:hypothetical protein